MSLFEWIFAIASVAFPLFILPLSMILLRLFLDRRVRKQLPRDQEYNHYPDKYFGLGRAIIFGCAAVWDQANQSWQMQEFYNGFDVKSFANRFEKFIAYSFLLSLAYIVIVGSIYILWAEFA